VSVDVYTFCGSVILNSVLRRTRRKRGDDDDGDEEVEDGMEEGPEDSDIEMEDVQAASSSKKARLRKGDVLEESVTKQSRAERLNARTQAKVSFFWKTNFACAY
jgi:hypothetical protein